MEGIMDKVQIILEESKKYADKPHLFQHFAQKIIRYSQSQLEKETAVFKLRKIFNMEEFWDGEADRVF